MHPAEGMASMLCREKNLPLPLHLFPHDPGSGLLLDLSSNHHHGDEGDEAEGDEGVEVAFGHGKTPLVSNVLRAHSFRQSGSTGPRRDFTSPRTFLAFRRRLTDPKVGLVGTRRLGAWVARSTSSARRVRAISRLRAWLRVS